MKEATNESFGLVLLSLKPDSRHSRISLPVSNLHDVRRFIPLASAFDSFHTTIFPRNMKQKEVRWRERRSVT